MAINKNELTKEQVKKAMQCETAEELMKLAKADGFSITKEEAEAYMTELADIDLDDSELKNIAGGDECYLDC
ncbi:MAG: Nif11-like leader peptide family RiPP precursor [Lachnospiraceae bacterium]|nr:Nif11-like leader peptide family RiPP precursor [Lachnospiraceae bacterium]